jgi:hypothetical protein
MDLPFILPVQPIGGSANLWHRNNHGGHGIPLTILSPATGDKESTPPTGTWQPEWPTRPEIGCSWKAVKLRIKSEGFGTVDATPMSVRMLHRETTVAQSLLQQPTLAYYGGYNASLFAVPSRHRMRISPEKGCAGCLAACAPNRPLQSAAVLRSFVTGGILDSAMFKLSNARSCKSTRLGQIGIVPREPTAGSCLAS